MTATGSSAAFIIAAITVVIRAVTGPVLNIPNLAADHQYTTIITFLMVFLIQKSKNKDSKAIHMKINEILASYEGASNRMVDIENLTEEELDNTPSYKTE